MIRPALATLLLITSLNAAASLGDATAGLNPTTPIHDLAQNDLQVLPIDLMMNYQIFAAQRSTSVEVLNATDQNGEDMPKLKNQLLDVAEGSILRVVDQSSDGQQLTLQLDVENMATKGDVSQMPRFIVVSARDLNALNLIKVDVGSLDNLDSIDDSIILPELVAGRHSGGRAPMTYCLGDVAGYASRVCGAPAPGVERASIAMSAFLGTGRWHRVSGSFSSMSIGTACFFGGGRQDCSGGSACGHTAIKIAANVWRGAGQRPVPNLPDENGYVRGVLRRPYIFQGCIAPNAGCGGGARSSRGASTSSRHPVRPTRPTHHRR